MGMGYWLVWVLIIMVTVMSGLGWDGLDGGVL